MLNAMQIALTDSPFIFFGVFVIGATFMEFFLMLQQLLLGHPQKADGTDNQILASRSIQMSLNISW